MALRPAATRRMGRHPAVWRCSLRGPEGRDESKLSDADNDHQRVYAAHREPIAQLSRWCDTFPSGIASRRSDTSVGVVSCWGALGGLVGPRSTRSTGSRHSCR